jgi:hypothetical protein
VDEQQVARLAQHETSVWASARTEVSATSVDMSEPSEGHGWSAYVPLDGKTPRAEPSDLDLRFRFLEVNAVGRTLIMRFAWHGNARPQEFLLPIDLREVDNADVASTHLLERVLFLLRTPDWVETRTVPISRSVRVVTG